jgi:hypothetical protein
MLVNLARPLLPNMEQTGTSIAMIQQNYGKNIRDDGSAPLRTYVEGPKTDSIQEKTGTFTETFQSDLSNYQRILASPTGFEPVSPA